MTDDRPHPHDPEVLPASLRGYAWAHGKPYTDAQVRELGRLAHALGAFQEAVLTLPAGAPMRRLAGGAVVRFFRNCRSEGAGFEARLLLRAGGSPSG